MMGHPMWDLIGALMVGGGSAAGVLLMAVNASRQRRRADAAWAEVRQLRRQLDAARRRDPLDQVLTAYRLTDTGWRAS